MATYILLAEDDGRIRRVVSGFLREEGFSVVEAADGNEALERFQQLSNHLALIILDVMMPGLDGYQVCRAIRERSALPILMLTARDSESDEITGFRCGADEYIAKPFSPSILLARIHNLLRRAGGDDLKDLQYQGLRVLLREHAVEVDGQRVFFTPKEFDLLCYLLKNKNLVLTRSQILAAVWDYDYMGDDRTIDTHIKCVRAKIGPYSSRIVTLRKVGYKFEAQQ